MDGMDGMLSQDEINALFANMDGDGGTAEGSEPLSENMEMGVENGTRDSKLVGDILTDIEKDAVGEISNIAMGTAATTLNALVKQPVNITTPKVSYGVWAELADDFQNRPCVALQLGYKEGLNGNNILVLRERDVLVITDLMMEGDGTNVAGEISELHLSAISEAMNQMMGSAATSLSSMIHKKIDILPPVAKVINFDDDFLDDPFVMDEYIKVAFKMTIGTLVDSEIMQLYPIDFAKKLYDMFSRGSEEEDAGTPVLLDDSDSDSGIDKLIHMNVNEMGPANQQQMPPYGQQPYPQQQMPPYGQQPYPQQQMPPYGQPYPQQQMPPDMNGQQPYPQQQMPPYGMPYPPYGQMPYMQQAAPVNVQQAQFQAFNNNVNPFQQKENINLIMDVPLEVSVELGKTTKSIQDILEFCPGTIIELDKITGEPVDIKVNGKYVARGEVVVIEESFAVRVTDIIK